MHIAPTSKTDSFTVYVENLKIPKNKSHIILHIYPQQSSANSESISEADRDLRTTGLLHY